MSARFSMSRFGMFSTCLTICGCLAAPSVLPAQCSGGGGGGGGGRMGGGSLGAGMSGGGGSSSGTAGMNFSPQMMNRTPQAGATASQAMAGFVDIFGMDDFQNQVAMDEMIAARQEAMRIARWQQRQAARRAAARERARLVAANGGTTKSSPFGTQSNSNKSSSSKTNTATKGRSSASPSQSASLSTKNSVSKSSQVNQPSTRPLASIQ